MLSDLMRCKVCSDDCENCHYSGDTEYCDECKKGYYKDTFSSCKKCTIEYCIDCISSSECVECGSGKASFLSDCEDYPPNNIAGNYSKSSPEPCSGEQIIVANRCYNCLDQNNYYKSMILTGNEGDFYEQRFFEKDCTGNSYFQKVIEYYS